MFIGKFLLAAVFDPLSCQEKIMDGLLLSIVDESSSPDSILNAYRLLLLEVPLSELACSEVDPTICEPSTVAGLQKRWSNTVCLDIFCLSFPSLL